MEGNNIELVTKYEASKKDMPAKGKPIFGKKKTIKKGVKTNGIFSKR